VVLLVAPAAEACRFVAYVGDQPLDAAELLVDPFHSLVDMATEPALCPGVRDSRRYNASQFALRNNDLNADGFGVAWYDVARAENFPRRVRAADAIAHGASRHHELLEAVVGLGDATRPYLASNMTCVSDVAPRTSAARSKAIFAHTRAASAGAPNTLNSHPFLYNTLTWMHNGGIAGFDDDDDEDTAASTSGRSTTTVKELLRSRLDPAIRRLVAGETDSEYAGAAFAHELRQFPQGVHYPLHSMRTALRRAIRHLAELAAEVSDGASSLNFAVTDGVSLVASRYRTSAAEDPPSLYFKRVRPFGGEGGPTAGVIVASEPLDDDLAHWTLLGKDRMLSWGPDEGLTVECVDYPLDTQACDSDLPLSGTLSDFKAAEEEARRAPAGGGVLRV